MNYTQQQLDLWNRIIDSFRESLNLLLFNEVIRPLELYAVTNDEVVATFKGSPYSMTIMMDRYHSRVQQVVQSTFGTRYILKVIDAKEIKRTEETIGHTMLNPKYTFENFVVGSSNNFAYAASLAVAEEPSEVYNPLFIYGDVGLGKTHLMNAIGNSIRASNPTANVLLTTSEHFTNELIEAIATKRGKPELRSRMRNVDVLMVDDIQFLSKTNVAQEEFFHTFNELHAKHKQIIISSDRPPKEIPTIEERLRSRFGWGLIVDIQKPDFETRMAILRRKADDEYIDIPYDVVEYIAAHFDKSIRDLEGALNRLQAQSKLLDNPITMDMAVRTLSSLGSANDSRVVTAESIMETVAKKYGVEVEDLLSKKRNREIAMPRQVAMYLCRELTSMSTTNIGRAFGGRDHTTVMHSCDKVADQMLSEFAFKKRVEELMDLVRNGRPCG